MSLKDNINRGFTVGDITTVNYDDEAKIKVKEYYELDKLERGKLLELAGQVDIELAKRDIKVEDLGEKIVNIEDKISNIGECGSVENKGYYENLDSLTSNTYVIHKFEVEQSKLDELGKLSLDKYNTLSATDKRTVGRVLEKVGITDPMDLESIENELSKPSSQSGGLILKVYGNSLRIPINKEFNFVVSDKIGLVKRAVTSKVLDVVLSKLPGGNYDSTHSTAIGSITNSIKTSIYSVGAYPPQDFGANMVRIINYLEDGKATNRFGVAITGGYTNLFETPYYIGGYEVEKVHRFSYSMANIFVSKNVTEQITTSNQNYGDTSIFDIRTVIIGDFEKFISYDITVRYKENSAGTSEILSNLLPSHLPFYESRWSRETDITFYGSDGSVSKGQLIGSDSLDSVGKIVHLGSKVKGITYTAKFKIRGAFQ